MPYLKAASRVDLWPGEMRGVVVAGVPVLLVNLDGTVYAYEDRCRHLGVRLSEGSLRDGVLTCRAHEWQYDPRTGSGCNPTGVQLHRLPVVIAAATGRPGEDDILVDVGSVPHTAAPARASDERAI